MVWALPVQTRVADAAEDLGLTLGVVAVSGPGREAARRAGRAAATIALRSLGSPTTDVDRAADGRPLWPPGTIGSISHAGRIAMAVVASSGRPVGVDVEVSGALSPADAQAVLDQSERLFVAGDHAPDRVCTRLWSAKEAAFKAWSTALGGLDGVDPIDIHVELGAMLRVLATGDLARRTRLAGPLTGTSIDLDDWVVSIVVGARAELEGAR